MKGENMKKKLDSLTGRYLLVKNPNSKIPPAKVVIDKPAKARRRQNVKKETRKAVMDI
jgi:hypothetical protein